MDFPPHKICQNKRFVWLIFFRITTESEIMSLYGEIRARENPHSAIFYAACGQLSVMNTFLFRRVYWAEYFTKLYDVSLSMKISLRNWSWYFHKIFTEAKSKSTYFKGHMKLFKNFWNWKYKFKWIYINLCHQYIILR